MGPYYRNTSQGTGSFFDAFYQHPILMVLFVVAAVGVAIYFWRRDRAGKSSAD